MERVVINAFSARCEGTSQQTIAPLAIRRANPTITVYSNGARDVGCAYLGPKGECLSVSIFEDRAQCIQLFPGNGAGTVIPHQLANVSEMQPLKAKKKGRYFSNPKTTDQSPVTFNTGMLRQKTIELGLSQAVIAAALDCSQSLISNVFANRRLHALTSIDIAYRLATFLNVSVEEIIANPRDAERVIKYFEMRIAREKDLQARAQTHDLLDDNTYATTR